MLYFDRFLSANQNQACASCHDPGAGFADPLNLRLPAQFPTSAGSFVNLFGGRNAPPASYAMFSPAFTLANVDGIPEGGQFWDGRVPSLKEQAKGPFLNPVEMAMPSEAAVIEALKSPANPNSAAYQILFDKAYKIDLAAIDTAIDVAGVTHAYDKMAQAIGQFEKSEAFAKFNSKFDAVMAGVESFTLQEANGWALFNGPAQCNLCHPAPLFTDFTYDNLGIPKSTHPILAANPVDLGLGALFPGFEGLFKVSSLRNIELTPPYGHNGFFANLKEIVHFYNTAGDGTWPAPEVAINVNRVELGDLGLTDAEEDDLVAFLKTLSDRTAAKSYVPMGLPPVLP